VENRKFHLHTFIGAFLAFLGAYLLIMDTYDSPYYEQYSTLNNYTQLHADFFIGIYSIAMLASASMMMKHMHTKESRIAYLMLPASALEKFISRTVYSTLWTTAILVLASLLAEAAHFVFMPFFDELPDKYRTCILPMVMMDIMELINPIREYVYMEFDHGIEAIPLLPKSLMDFGIACWLHSLYILGGNWLGRYAFFKTTGIVLILSIVYSQSPFLMDASGKYLDKIPWETGCIAIACLTLSLTLLHWWLSYRLFVRRQAAEPKFRLPW